MESIRRMRPGHVLRALMCAFTAAYLVAGLLAPDLSEMLPGLARICTAPAQLTTDYFKPELGSISGAMLNAFLVGGVFCAMMFLPGAKVSGVTVLAFFLTMGFTAFGISILNILPFILGIYAYALSRRKPFAHFIHFAMFSTALGPLVTQALFYYPVMGESPNLTPAGVLLALAIGVITGFAMPTLCAHSQSFHKGYNFFNAGPAAGFLCFLFYAVMYRTLGVEAPALRAALGEGNRPFVNTFCGVVFGLCVAAGIAINGGAKGYGALLRDTGYKSDFTEKYPVGLNILNIGVTGLFVLLYYNLIGAKFTGPTMGMIICMMCSSCCGGTPLNFIPIMLGYGVMGVLYRLGVTAFPINAQGLIVGLCFASGLAPIAGEYGVVAGIVAGILHYCLVTSVPVIHGGFNLYNGGFTAGIVCFIYVPILEHYFKRKSERKGAENKR